MLVLLTINIKRRKAEWSSYHFTLLFMISLFFLLVTSNLFATPRTPSNGDEIITTLPNSQKHSKKIQSLRQQLAANPGDAYIAEQLATHYIQIARTSSDNRYYGYAKAVLKPWLSPEQHAEKKGISSPPPPAEIVFLQAVLQQHEHQYTKAKATLKMLIQKQPRHSQAWLTLSIIQQLQGDYTSARGSCAALGKVASSWLSSLCYSQIMSLTGSAERALTLQQALALQLGSNHSNNTKTLQWVLGLSAETAYRLGDTNQAKTLFEKAIALSQRDAYLLRVYSDFLLTNNQPQPVLKLLKNETHDDALLLRLAIAAKSANVEKLSQRYQKMLISRYEAARLRNSSLHERDEALFLLEFSHTQLALKKALALAKDNWKIQKEPDDALILLRAAIANQSSVDLQTIQNWIKTNQLQDVRITKLLNQPKVHVQRGRGAEINHHLDDKKQTKILFKKAIRLSERDAYLLHVLLKQSNRKKGG